MISKAIDAKLLVNNNRRGFENKFSLFLPITLSVDSERLVQNS
jgi:hypothetical protein